MTTSSDTTPLAPSPVPAPPPPDHASVEERRARGRALRRTVPRRAHAQWRAPADRRSPVDVLEQQSAGRLPDLVPVRYGRMLASPFAFYRGSAAIMAMDLATLPLIPLHVQLCGDAHLVNFGVYGSPERELLFDINDFDETSTGPFDWDVKRLAASFVLAARANHFTSNDARTIALAASAAYREAMQRFAAMRTLDIWYSHVTMEEVTRMLASSKAKRNAATWIQRTRSNTSIKALNALTEVVDGKRRIVDDPPLIERTPPEASGAELLERLRHGIQEYRHTLPLDRRHMLDQYQALDAARKVVGVGSVGTRCYIVLLEGRNIDDPLFLQIKEAQPSVLEPYLGKSPQHDHGERVVVGQRRMQAASDVFLGWYREPGGSDYYVRQLKDLKGSVPVESVTPSGLLLYARVCGGTLARAHARSGDSIAIAGYLGRGLYFDEALASFAVSYADQTERDYHEFQEAHRGGRINATVGH
jgi:uncharacterized protein (DUF2252 family)